VSRRKEKVSADLPSPKKMEQGTITSPRELGETAEGLRINGETEERPGKSRKESGKEKSFPRKENVQHSPTPRGEGGT